MAVENLMERGNTNRSSACGITTSINGREAQSKEKKKWQLLCGNQVEICRQNTRFPGNLQNDLGVSEE